MGDKKNKKPPKKRQVAAFVALALMCVVAIVAMVVRSASRVTDSMGASMKDGIDAFQPYKPF